MQKKAVKETRGEKEDIRWGGKVNGRHKSNYLSNNSKNE